MTSQMISFIHYDKRDPAIVAEIDRKYREEMPALPVPPETVTFRSGEGELFKTHFSNLRGALHLQWRTAPPGTIIDLPEDTYTMNLLWDYFFTRGPRPLSGLPIEDICAIADMASKYDLDHVIAYCFWYTEFTLRDFPLETVAYAHRDGRPDLLDRAAPFTIAKQQNEARNKFPPVLFTAWTEYANAWRCIIEGPDSCSYSKNKVFVSDFPNANLSFNHGEDGCEVMANIESAICRGIATHGVALLLRANLAELEEELKEIAGECTHVKRSVLESKVACVAMVQAWISQVKERKSEIAPFSDFVNAIGAPQ